MQNVILLVFGCGTGYAKSTEHYETAGDRITLALVDASTAQIEINK